ncbi:MAG TPA: sulfurtransferase TusA family protein [Acidimicrobiia bacterium]|jgi:tRNA 2-thiouridine synthesizing protein A|nr:sulfurtransferase TusA family protein [Acidimicrobiia bacterium]
MNMTITNPIATSTLADEVLDSRDVSCPLPIIQTAQAMASLSSGQTLLVLASDPGFEPDIKAWSSRTGNALLSSERQGNEFHALLRKA